MPSHTVILRGSFLSYSYYYDSIQNSIVQRYLAMGQDEAAGHAPIIRNLLTEELLKAELTPYLPRDLLISKGEVIKGNKSSGDCDLIIYTRPIIYQYGSISIVPYGSAKAIIDVEIEGARFLKAKLSPGSKPSKRVQKKMNDLEKLKEFADKVLCVGLHGHAASKVFKWWLTTRREFKGQTPIFIFYTKHNKKIVSGEFERLIQEIQEL